jgi:tRNA pseudouridine55 synthase
MATGLLAVLLGSATRLEPYLTRLDKTYLGQMELGLTTDTDDLTGRPLRRQGPPWPAEAAVQKALEEREGERDQVPPAFSAVKIAGRRAYRAARAGESLELPPRRVTAFRLEPLKYEPPRLDFRAEVSSGYYIRSLVRDLGETLGPGGALSALRRERVGPWSVTQAVTLNELAVWSENDWRRNLRPPAAALPHLTALILEDRAALDFVNGRSAGAGTSPAGTYKILNVAGQLIGLGQIDPSTGGEAPRGPFLRPLRVFPPGGNA